MTPESTPLNPAQIMDSLTAASASTGQDTGGRQVQAVASTPADEMATLREAIRARNAHRLEAMLQLLEPQVDGTYGPVNPRLVELYIKAMVELGKLYRVYDPVPPAPPVEDPEVAAAVLRAQAEKQLTQLADRI